MREIIFLLVLNICLYSCFPHGDGIDVVVKNETADTLGSAKIFTWLSELELGDIAPKSKATGFLDMKNEPKSDGGYHLLYIEKNGKEVIVPAGYYTLGSPSDRRITFIIERDTIKVKFSNFGRSFK